MEKERHENLAYLQEAHPDLYRAYQEYGKQVHEQGGPLDTKSRWLIKIAVSASLRYELALETHIEKGKAAGCSREEIEHTILLTAPSAGFPTMMEALLVLRRVWPA